MSGTSNSREPVSRERAVRRKILKAIPAFQDLSGRVLHDVVESSCLEERRRGRVLFRRGETADKAWAIGAGRVRVCLESPDGREFMPTFREGGDLVGEEALFSMGAHRGRAEVVDDAVLVAIPIKHLRRVTEKNAAVAFRFAQRMAEQCFSSEALVQGLLFCSVEARLASALSTLARDHGQAETRGVRITRKVTHAELARIVGSTRETVTLTLSKLKRRGLLVLERRNILVCDPVALTRLGADPY